MPVSFWPSRLMVPLPGTSISTSLFFSENTYWKASLPIALQTGETLLILPDSLLIIDQFGKICRRHAQEHILPDDSGYSPNLTYSGILILATRTGEVTLFQNNVWQEIGVFGYDIVPPAVYPDNSLAINGFASAKGFCRVRLDGTLHWTTHLKDADLLPTLNAQQIVAIGSLSDKHSAFFRSTGEQMGEYHHAATFAVFPDGSWITLSERRLARLTLEGREVWGREISRADGLSFVEQPLVDTDGFIFVRQKEGFLCCDPDGQTAFEVKTPPPPQGLMSIVAPRVVAFVQENELFLGHG